MTKQESPHFIDIPQATTLTRQGASSSHALQHHSFLVGIFLEQDVAARLFFATDGECLWRRYVLDLDYYRFPTKRAIS